MTDKKFLRALALTLDDYVTKVLATSDKDMAYFYVDKSIALLEEMRREIYMSDRRSGEVK